MPIRLEGQKDLSRTPVREALNVVEITQLHRQMVKSFQDKNLLLYFEANQIIHQLIVDGAHNRVLSRIYKAESLQIRRYRYAGNLAQIFHEKGQRPCK